MLEVKNASLQIGGGRLFQDLSFAVGDGELLCVTGPSGSGKTTLLCALLGFLPLDGGYISVDGELLTPSSVGEFRKTMAYVPQDISMPAERVGDLCSLLAGLKANRGAVFSRERLVAEWGMLGLDASLYDKPVASLSGGELRRVVLSVCGLMKKKIVLADEPASGLDPDAAGLVADYLRRMASAGCSVVAVSHDPAFAASCDRVVTL